MVYSSLITFTMKIILTVLSANFIFVGWGQASTDRYVTPIDIPTNIERYNIDYKLVDESVLVSDSLILNQIDLDSLDALRFEEHSVTVHDNATNLDVILFHEKKSKISNNNFNTIEQ